MDLFHIYTQAGNMNKLPCYVYEKDERNPLKSLQNIENHTVV